ncbi:hypothetical protein [Roseateles amylovorans]|uniref:Uncharacterized protein n=1 Tax=Roseateles amylovorans TaxID=2978473 RepID=A0ABY6AZ63_9BURK|nr:hypothetical protein [Roseateles amylovorans]UXH77578.1 hypothetical protein N4261_21710 [Roseateles amylovorans]
MIALLRAPWRRLRQRGAGMVASLLLAPAAYAFEVLPASEGEPRILIDGRLDEAIWTRAPVHDQFAQLQPRANAAYPEALRTEVRLVADGQSLIVGIRAWSAQPPHVRLSRRDAVQRDQDMIGLWIDTGGRGESAMFVKASLAGVVTDGLYRASDDEEDLGPDFPVEVSTQRLSDGYSMEIRWPLAALRYPYQMAAPWRLVVARAVPGADDLLLVSGAADNEALDFLHASTPVNGLEPVLSRHRDRQEGQVTVEWTGRSVREGGQDRRDGSLGLEGWWRPRADWLVNATLNPDFAQVDVDAPQTSGNRAVALALPEKRRYFLESADVLGLPLQAFYSRTIADPRWGLRSTWRGASADASLLLSEDRAGAVVTRGRPWGTDEWTLDAPSVSQLLRARVQSGEDAGRLTQGVLVARRSLDAHRYNQLVGADGLWRSSDDDRHLKVQWNALISEHTLNVDDDGRTLRQAARAQRDLQVATKLLYSDEQWLNAMEASVVGPDFVNLLGFVDQAGLWKVSGELNRRMGERSLPIGEGLTLHQTELHVSAAELRSLRDRARDEPGGEVIRRELRLGVWAQGDRRTDGWLQFGADRQRARSGGRLHATPAWHGGFESTPVPWMPRLTGEGSWGRQLDSEFDRVGRGGWWSLQASSRWALPGDRSLEIDPVLTGVTIDAQGPYPSLDERGVRLLSLLHLNANESIRLILQDERSRRGMATGIAPTLDRKRHRSLMWKKRFGGRYQAALGAQRDESSRQATRSEVFLKLQVAFDGH